MKNLHTFKNEIVDLNLIVTVMHICILLLFSKWWRTNFNFLELLWMIQGTNPSHAYSKLMKGILFYQISVQTYVPLKCIIIIIIIIIMHRKQHLYQVINWHEDKFRTWNIISEKGLWKMIKLLPTVQYLLIVLILPPKFIHKINNALTLQCGVGM